MNVHHILKVWLGVILLGSCCTLAGAREENESQAAARADASTVPLVPITRADFATGYIAFDRAWRAAKPEGEKLIEVNKRFDAITQQFFSGRQEQGLRELAELAWYVANNEPMPSELAAVSSLKATMDPHSYAVFPPLDPKGRVRIGSFYELPEAQAGDYKMELLLRYTGDPAPRWTRELTLTLGPGRRADMEIDVESIARVLVPGIYELAFRVGQRELVSEHFFVVIRPPSYVRAALNDQLNVVINAGDSMRREIDIIASRIQLLADDPDPSKSAEFLVNPIMLSAEIAAEVRRIDEGENPFESKPGDWWRLVRLDGDVVMPMRIFGPPMALRNQQAMPLVIALHGAGGDESMFMEGYGAGQLRELAVRHGFLAVSVSTIIFASNPSYIDTLLNDLSVDYRVDRSRVYVLGHSLGAVAAAGLAAARPDRIAAAACIAGFRPFDAQAKPAPTLVLGGELDPIMPPSRFEAAAKEAAERGQPVEYRLVAGQGHTLIVNHELPGVIDWLMGKRIDPAVLEVAPATAPAEPQPGATSP